jgi:4'-phosphopantetheinyl transferase
VALARGEQEGADHELLRPPPRALALAERFFAPAETEVLAALPAAAQEAAFVRLWCAKEAVLKAHGRGLAFGLHRLQFALRDGEWTLVACDPELGRPADWTLHAFMPIPGYLASLAWRSIPRPLLERPKAARLWPGLTQRQGRVERVVAHGHRRLGCADGGSSRPGAAPTMCG